MVERSYSFNDIPAIQVLSPEVAARIAAGEVIERPASVVKELIENALDAGATAIQVEVREGGFTFIRVADNGHGIPRDQLPLALARFATNKIRTAEDLSRVRTLGFRGEALPSIAAVARVEILTRTAGEIEGTRLIAEEGRQIVQPAASPVGTAVTVRDLFYNTPARRRFLKSPLREAERIRETVHRYALGYPHVAFRLIIDGREVLIAPPGTPLERAAAIWGREVADELIPVSWEAADLRIHGLISRPTLGRASRAFQHFYVNGRPIRSGLLAVALERPYAGRLPAGRYPLAILHIDLPPAFVDVNVHPQKAEVRFSQERSVYWGISQAVEAALAPFPRPEEATIAWPFEEAQPAPRPLAEPSVEYGRPSRWRAVGQLLQSYILAQSEDGLIVVDQHAAHEQVLFERLWAGDAIHPLPSPLVLSFSAREAEQLEAELETLRSLGFDLEPFGGNAFVVRALPASLAEQPVPALLNVVLEEAAALRRGGGDPRERIAMRLACTAAVKAGDGLSLAEMQALLDALQETWSPATCPHGRPAWFLLSREEIERRFLRR
ncbi:DNA mismatch repair endonuclease MutL [Thermoflexus sp.]|uniref:DNA mismatch repair endonuclease MutL n=1 Tax=Thermoflexus sp. TaxID=1969742 RepID=UPI0035E450F3